MKSKENENYDINKPDIDRYIEELYKIKSENSKRANAIARRGLEELGLSTRVKNNNYLGIDIEWATIIGITIAIMLCGLLAPKLGLIAIYIFGTIFFFAGLYVALHIPVFGLIFLCSHGGSGLFLMIISLFGSKDGQPLDFDTFIDNPVFSDGGIPNDLKNYLIIIAALFITAIVYTILHNLSPRLKENKKHMIIILLLFFIAILLTALLPRIFPYIIQ